MERHRRACDNWGRLVESTLKRDYLREIALCPSISTSTVASSSSPDFTTSPSPFSFRLNSVSPQLPVYAKHQSIANHSILLASYLLRAADSVSSSYKEAYLDLQSRTQKLLDLVYRTDLAAHELYDRATRRLIHDTSHCLHKALCIMLKCRAGVPAAAAFSDASALLYSSIRNLCWLLRVEEGPQGMPPPISLHDRALCEV